MSGTTLKFFEFLSVNEFLQFLSKTPLSNCILIGEISQLHKLFFVQLLPTRHSFSALITTLSPKLVGLHSSVRRTKNILGALAICQLIAFSLGFHAFHPTGRPVASALLAFSSLFPATFRVTLSTSGAPQSVLQRPTLLITTTYIQCFNFGKKKIICAATPFRLDEKIQACICYCRETRGNFPS